jgi:hypothetical protein
MTEQKTHFKKLLNPLYLGSHDLETGKEYQVIIERIDRDVEVIGDGGKKQKKAICHFKGASKPMILNATNMKMIAVVTGSKFIEDWIGKAVIIKVIQERAFGELLDVVRVMNKKA